MAPTKTDKVKKEAADNSTPIQAAANVLPALRSGASRGGAVSGRGGSAVARGGIGKARRAGPATLGTRNAAPYVVDAVGRVLGLATPSPGPAVAPRPTSAPASASTSSTTVAVKTTAAKKTTTPSPVTKTTTAAKANNKPLQQQAIMAPQPKPEAVASDKELRYTGGDLSLLESGDLHDALIVSKEVTWKVHKTILYPRSTWFRDAFSNPVEVSHVTLPSLCFLEGM